jgi:hypothetical protein
LRRRWRKLHRAPAPENIPGWLLRRMLAYRIQAAAFGNLDRKCVEFLDQIARAREQQRMADGGRLKKRPIIPPAPSSRSLKPGTILVREHAGELQRVIVLERGFSWNERQYQSLSQIASAMTGTTWNGPRFFGLRDKKTEEKRVSEARS